MSTVLELIQGVPVYVWLAAAVFLLLVRKVSLVSPNRSAFQEMFRLLFLT
jgi:hypothetical protein